MEADGQIPYTTIGDETYFALASNPNYNINYTWQTFVRMDWLKQVGYDHVPTKRDEYLDAMKKIQEAGLCEHPGGGTMITGLGSDQNHAYREYPFNELDWAMYGDYNIPALGTDANYNLLKRANEDYNNGNYRSRILPDRWRRQQRQTSSTVMHILMAAISALICLY